jgi:ATP-dependent protease ClpP protease subunit
MRALLGAGLLFARVVCADPFEDGLAAYQRGDYETAYQLLSPLAEHGQAAAQFNLGVLFENGLGVAQDQAAAARWYLKAAEQGDAAAQYNVAQRYEKGNGLPLDLDKARYWYRRVIANSEAEGETSETKRGARERLASLSPPEEVIGYEGGRFVLRRSVSGTCVIALQGFVTRHASFKFDDVVKKAAAGGCSKPLVMLLESPGGSLFDGISLGQEVHSQGLTTVARYACASACSIIFLGGSERMLAGSRAQIGFHQAALLGEKEKRCETAIDSPGVIRIRRYLHFVVPANADRIFQLIMETSCNSIEWVSGERALELGVATKLESEGVDVFGPKSDR